jgi:hypothetical protein
MARAGAVNASRRLQAAAVAMLPPSAHAGEDYGFLITGPFFAGIVGGVVFGYLQAAHRVPGILGILGAVALAVAADVYLHFTGPPAVFVPLWTTTFVFFGALPFLIAQWIGYRMGKSDAPKPTPDKPAQPQG